VVAGVVTVAILVLALVAGGRSLRVLRNPPNG
jgi:hypothetical protein